MEYATVGFPAGTYLISDSIRFSRFMVVCGARQAEYRDQGMAEGRRNLCGNVLGYEHISLRR